MTMRSLLLAGCLVLSAAPALAETLVVDAHTVPAAPIEGYLKTGTLVSPTGHAIGVNERYLTLDGKPWMPVMGEFHYTRYPADAWEDEILKMKAAGVTIVSTYVIWNQHESQPGQFNWSGDRDLRRFAQLVQKHGMMLAARIGPWAHAEARFGGFPDWVVDAMPTRGNDPEYLGYVDRLYGEVGKQLSGLMWKDGGPVVIVQLENEYNLTGPGQGPEHIATLKKMAIAHGLDAPLYTVTGWDHTHYPSDEVAPVFGGYPDEPWNASASKLSPREPYAFRFASRTGADLGAQTRSSQMGTADAEGAKTPFLGAEFGGGVPAMYRRRPVIAPDDLGSMVTVQLGSGVNLYGYYMFHGGRNPGPGSDAIQESTGSGGYNDVPRIGYDFQAPLGEFGQVRPVMGVLRPLHIFMETFGDKLAPMTVRVPAVVSKAREDLTTPRFAVRSDGRSGFVFMSNYVRQYPMAVQKDVRFQVDLAKGPLTFPSQAVDVPNGAYFIWPFNMDLAGVNLAWATAQPITYVHDGATNTFVFYTAGDMPAEFAFDGAVSVKASSGKVTRQGGKTLVRGIKTGPGEGMSFTSGGRRVRILLLDKSQAAKLSVLRVAGQQRLVLSDDPVFADDEGLDVRSVGDPGFRFGVYPALKTAPTGDLTLRSAGQDGVFQMFEASAVARTIPVKVTPLRPARSASPILVGGPPKAALEPMPEQFGRSAAWTIETPTDALDGVNDVFLRIDYKGDVGRLFSGVRMLDDHYFNGQAWEVGLKRFAVEAKAPLTVTVLPLRQDAPIYIEDGYRPQIAAGGQVAEVVSVTAVPEYRLRVRIAP